jgi:hypothetical protein
VNQQQFGGGVPRRVCSLADVAITLSTCTDQNREVKPFGLQLAQLLYKLSLYMIRILRQSHIDRNFLLTESMCGRSKSKVGICALSRASNDFSKKPFHSRLYSNHVDGLV